MLAALLVWVALVTGATAAPKAELWPRWQAHDAASAATIDHGPWGRFLGRYLVRHGDGITRVRYAAVDAQGRRTLDEYLGALGETPISSRGRDQQMAYWINLYNALTVRVVLDHYPVDSIREIRISPGILSLFTGGPWGAKLIEVEGEALSLDDIEHRILRPIWRDPRIHYALNCAALGCPNLQPEPFRAEMLDRQLDQAARQFVNHARGARIAGGDLIVSSIYHWFQDDFGGSPQGVLDHLRAYARPDLRRQLERFTSIGGHGYDWGLNDASGLDEGVTSAE